MKKRPGWITARKATLARDKHTCQKCGAREYLEVHHKRPRSQGGSDRLSNLVVLCRDCHAEWTWCEPSIRFASWRSLPPARWLIPLLDKPWPADISAAAYREQLILAFASFSTRKRT